MQTNKIVYLHASREEALKGQILDFASRYNHSRLLAYSEHQVLTFGTYDRNYNPVNHRDVKRVSKDEVKYYQVTSGTEFKPWLISTEAYGDPAYWWYIMEYNNIFDVEEITMGKTLKIPPIHTIIK